MIINGVELECFDTADADVMEHYESALNKVTKEIRNLDGSKYTKSQAIRKICQAIFSLFNELFGEGTDRKVFGDKVNMNICLNAYYELIENVNKSYDSFGADITAKVKAQNFNRQQKRSSKKKKHYNHYRPKLANPK